MLAELVGYSELAKVCAETIYPDMKNKVFGLIQYFEAKKNIPTYLENLLNRNHFIQSLLFEDGKILFDDFYIKHKVQMRSQRKAIPITSCEEFFSSYKSISIVGDAGLGKSSFAKYLIRSSIKENYKIPFIIEIRKHHANDNFEEILKKEFEVYSRSHEIPIDFIRDGLSKGKFLIIFDGYDEVPSKEIPRLHTRIDQFSTKYSSCPMVILGRPYSHLESFLSFKLIELSSFEREDVLQFIDNLKPHFEAEFIVNLTKCVNQTTYSHFKDYLKNPLLLSSFIISFKHHTSFIPEQLSSFYTEVIEALFFKHDRTTKNSFQRSLESGLSKEEVKTFLESFSFIMTQREIFEFSQSACEQHFEKIIKKINIKCEFENLKIDLMKSLALWIKDGIYFKFFHRSIQEYFFAMAVSKLKSRKEEYYLSLLENKYLSRMSNFSVRLELLYEVDHDDFNKFLIIPFIDRILTGFKDKSPKEQVQYLLESVIKKQKFRIFPHRGKFVPLTMVIPNLTKVILEHILKRNDKLTLIKDIDSYLTKAMFDYIKEQVSQNIDPERLKQPTNLISIVEEKELLPHIQKLLIFLEEAKSSINEDISINIFDDFILSK